jgi:hypothetical protein
MNNKVINTGMRFEFKTDLKKPRHMRDTGRILIKKEPLLRRHIVLAYQIQEFFEKEKAKNLRQVSQWLHMTHARISQIMNLLLLAPDIQEEILFSDREKIFQITEHKIRKIPIEINWARQREMWNEICKALINSPHPK